MDKPGFKFDKDGAWIVKDPNSTKDYQIDFATEGDSFLIDGDTLVAVDWTVPAGIVKETDVFTNTTATIWLSGGTVGVSYSIVCHFTTANGIIDDRTFRVVIKQQ